MAAKVKVTINEGAVSRVVGPQIDRAAYKAAQKTRGRVMSNIRQAGRVDTGRMISSLQVRREGTSTDLQVVYSVGSTARAQGGFDYPAAQEFGTRPHGPVTAKVLAFVPKGGSAVVFAKWVRGVTPGRFFQRALQQASVSDFTS